MAIAKKIKKVLLMQPNFSILNKRSWKLIPYNLALLKACLGSKYETILFDPNLSALPEAEIRQKIRDINPDVVGITSSVRLGFCMVATGKQRQKNFTRGRFFS